jgi:hypothetical protein
MRIYRFVTRYDDGGIAIKDLWIAAEERAIAYAKDIEDRTGGRVAVTTQYRDYVSRVY